jgi:magnesium chelatase family protein
MPARSGDFAEVRGQSGAKRALEIAAAGGLGVVMVGPPGTGKSMLAQRFVSLLPALDDDEALESAAVLSLTGAFSMARWGLRVMRAPHHSASSAALVGGGSPPRPGEITLAHHGVLFLDELPEFPRSALEALREPLETGRITISRAARQADFPARFQFLAAMNPCPCGHLGSARHACRCTPDAVARYQGRTAGRCSTGSTCRSRCPTSASMRCRRPPDGEPSAAIAARVAAARSVALSRQRCLNAQLEGDALDRHAALAPDALRFLQTSAARLGWSARSFHRVLRSARTIADLAGSDAVLAPHLAEAIQYRRVLAAV